MRNCQNIRLLLRDEDGVVQAVVLDNELEAKSGTPSGSYPAELGDAMKKFGEPANADKVSNLWTPKNGMFMVALSVSDIFKRAARAQKDGAPFVDLTKHSGVAAIKAKANKL